MKREIGPEAALALRDRPRLPLEPHGNIAIKRDVHTFEVETDAATFAAAFREVVTDPNSVFGLIRVKRPAERMGKPFEVGERFQGCFSIERALARRLNGSAIGRMAHRVLSTRPAQGAITWLEDRFLSNYAEVEVIEADADATDATKGAFRLVYRYLDGTPIAGSTTFLIEPRGSDRCLVSQIFEYQEVDAMALSSFQRFGLKFHDQVVYEEVHQAAGRAGVRVLSSTIPVEYGTL